MRRFAMVAAALIGLTACSADAKDEPGSKATTSQSTATTVVEAGFGTTGVSTPFTSPPAVITAVDLGLHDGFERIVFRFGANAKVPGYNVELAKPPFLEDGSGDEVAVGGTGHIAVRLTAAAHTESGQPSYSGGTRINGSDSIAEVVRTGDFEGLVHFVIGTNGDRAFRVFTLAKPARLVIDVQGP